MISLLYTPWVKQPVSEGAAPCCQGVLYGVRGVNQQRRQLSRRPVTYCLRWIKGAPQDRAGPPDQPVQPLSVPCGYAAATKKSYRVKKSFQSMGSL